jgi:hypothetical protein
MKNSLLTMRSRKMLYQGLFGFLALALWSCGPPTLAAENEQAPPAAPASEPPNQAAQPETQQAPSYQEVPRTLTLPAGTVIRVRISQLLSSDQNLPGDSFSGELEQPLVVNGWVVARRGQTVLGRVAVAQKAGRVKGVSQLGIELTHIVLVDGQQLPVRTQLIESSGGKSQGRDAAAIGTAGGVGAAIGAAAHGGEGAGIGAAIGAAAGLAGALLTRGRPTVIPPETLLTFRMESPLAISTDRSHVAFRPVEPEDYNSGTLRRRSENFAVAPPYPAPPPFYYWEPYPWVFYPGPFFFGSYGFGSRYGWRGFRR